ncbi:Uncharacterised protein [uncultured archaeon]|nr:Uncharacterised protein [uncultured archaeon]
MMQYIAIELQSSIHIGEAKPDFKFLPTQEIIPGSVIRGTLA